MTNPDEWFFDSNPFYNGNYTQRVFTSMLKDFRPDTPEFIKDLFKDCVKFRKSTRMKFKVVS